MLLEVIGMCKKCKPGILDSTLTNTSMFQRAFEMGFFACKSLHLMSVRLFCSILSSFCIVSAKRDCILNKASGCQVPQKSMKRCSFCSHII